MLFQFIDFVTANRAVLESNLLLWKLIEKLMLLGDEFNDSIRIQGINHKGLSISKKQKKAALSRSLIDILNLLYNNCLMNNQMDAIGNFKSTEKKLLHMAYNKLLNYAEDILSYCDKHTTELAEMGITDLMLSSLKNTMSELRIYMPLPQEMIKKREEATRAIMKKGKAIDLLQTERLDKLMESFYKVSNENLYTAYQQAVKREKASSRKLALMGTVKDKITQKPIKHAHILINKLDIDHIVRGEKGGFRIPNLEADTYPVEISAVNFVTQKITLVHNYGETDRLDILLEPELIAGESH